MADQNQQQGPQEQKVFGVLEEGRLQALVNLERAKQQAEAHMGKLWVQLTDATVNFNEMRQAANQFLATVRQEMDIPPEVPIAILPSGEVIDRTAPVEPVATSE